MKSLECVSIWNGPIMVLEQIANLSLGVIRVLSSSLSRSAKLWRSGCHGICYPVLFANLADVVIAAV